MRTYSELITLPTFEERFEYLKLGGRVGESTFGFDRYLNQVFYKSQEWKKIRRDVIIRDNGCDLAIEGYSIASVIIIHHINPVTVEDIIKYSDYLLNPEYLICTSYKTHDAIHFSDIKQLPSYTLIERQPFDTCPWRRK